jgi:hypothetical protein
MAENLCYFYSNILSIRSIIHVIIKRKIEELGLLFESVRLSHLPVIGDGGELGLKVGRSALFKGGRGYGWWRNFQRRGSLVRCSRWWPWIWAWMKKRSAVGGEVGTGWVECVSCIKGIDCAWVTRERGEALLTWPIYN